MITPTITLPEKFYNEEIRCDYTVSREIKKLWACQLDLLSKLQEVCDRNNLKVFACGGTLLGTIRHKGFIPWDDDIDLLMFRDDYDRLLEIASKEFKDPYFLQTCYSDSWYKGFAKLRNSSTTCITPYEKEMGPDKIKYNQGINIDIFPFDAVSNKKIQAFFDSTRIKIHFALRNVLFKKETNLSTKDKVINLFCKLFNLSEEKENLKGIKIAKKYKNSKLDTYGPWSFFLRKKFCVSIQDYKEFMKLPFENLEILVPKGFDTVLRTQYGDYNEYVIGSALHLSAEIDFDTPYNEYIKNNS